MELATKEYVPWSRVRLKRYTKQRARECAGCDGKIETRANYTESVLVDGRLLCGWRCVWLLRGWEGAA